MAPVLGASPTSVLPRGTPFGQLPFDERSGAPAQHRVVGLLARLGDPVRADRPVPALTLGGVERGIGRRHQTITVAGVPGYRPHPRHSPSPAPPSHRGGEVRVAALFDEVAWAIIAAVLFPPLVVRTVREGGRGKTEQEDDTRPTRTAALSALARTSVGR